MGVRPTCDGFPTLRACAYLPPGQFDTRRRDCMSRFVGVQSVSRFPEYRLVRTEARILNNISAAAFPPPDPHVNYGLVGIIDSGTNPADPFLQAWVLQHYEKWVPTSSPEHGPWEFCCRPDRQRPIPQPQRQEVSCCGCANRGRGGVRQGRWGHGRPTANHRRRHSDFSCRKGVESVAQSARRPV